MLNHLVECDEIEHAEDEVVMERVPEFSQLDLGETIVSARQITDVEYLDLFDVDNDYLSRWTDEEKRRMIHKIDYEA